jgi:hypothetical protein
VQILDGLGMKYTVLIFCLAMTVVTATLRAPAQTAFVASSPGFSVSSPGVDSTQPGSIVTIHTRVNEVNVLHCHG